MVIKLADGKPRSVPQRAVSLSCEFHGFSSLDEFKMLETNCDYVVRELYVRHPARVRCPSLCCLRLRELRL